MSIIWHFLDRVLARLGVLEHLVLLDFVHDVVFLIGNLLPEAVLLRRLQAHPVLGDAHIFRVQMLFLSAEEELLLGIGELAKKVAVLHVDGLLQHMRQDLAQ